MLSGGYLSLSICSRRSTDQEMPYSKVDARIQLWDVGEREIFERLRSGPPTREWKVFPESAARWTLNRV